MCLLTTGQHRLSCLSQYQKIVNQSKNLLGWLLLIQILEHIRIGISNSQCSLHCRISQNISEADFRAHLGGCKQICCMSQPVSHQITEVRGICPMS